MIPFTYLLHSSLYLLLFYGCYSLWLRRTTFFALNRTFLLASLILSLLLPLIELPSELVKTVLITRITLPEVTVGQRTTADGDTFSAENWLILLYGLGIGFMLCRLVYQLVSVYRLTARGSHERTATYTLVRLPDDSTSSFSFGRYLVLNATDARAENPALLRHEEAHIRQHHTLDVLFVSLVQLFFWFNPVLVWYKRSLQEVHEFLADRSAQRTPTADYSHQLVAYALHVAPSMLVAAFSNTSTLKQRLLMLQKPVSPRRSLLGYALVLPLAATLFMCTQNESDTAVPSSTARKAVKVDGDFFIAQDPDQVPEFPGGMQAVGEFLSRNLKYPAAAQKVNAEGEVIVSFVVTKTGEIADAKIVKDIGFGTGEEAKRVIEQMPRWIPCKQYGRAVNSHVQMPINFTLD